MKLKKINQNEIKEGQYVIAVCDAAHSKCANTALFKKGCFFTWNQRHYQFDYETTFIKEDNVTFYAFVEEKPTNVLTWVEAAEALDEGKELQYYISNPSPTFNLDGYWEDCTDFIVKKDTKYRIKIPNFTKGYYYYKYENGTPAVIFTYGNNDWYAVGSDTPINIYLENVGKKIEFNEV